MDIKSPTVLKLKAGLFLVIAVLCVVMLHAMLAPLVTWRVVVLFGLTIWSCCRAYYFCFYVMEHYAAPGFRYAGLWDLMLHLTGFKQLSPSQGDRTRSR